MGEGGAGERVGQGRGGWEREGQGRGWGRTQHSSTHSEAQGVGQQLTQPSAGVVGLSLVWYTSLVVGCLQHCLGEELTGECVALSCPVICHMASCVVNTSDLHKGGRREGTVRGQ